jgi:hypothetical protein
MESLTKTQLLSILQKQAEKNQEYQRRHYERHYKITPETPLAQRIAKQKKLDEKNKKLREEYVGEKREKQRARAREYMRRKRAQAKQQQLIMT